MENVKVVQWIAVLIKILQKPPSLGTVASTTYTNVAWVAKEVFIRCGQGEPLEEEYAGQVKEPNHKAILDGIITRWTVPGPDRRGRRGQGSDYQIGVCCLDHAYMGCNVVLQGPSQRTSTTGYSGIQSRRC